MLRGQFQNGQLITGQLCQLIGAKCENKFYMPVFTKPEGKIYEFEAPNKKSIGESYDSFVRKRALVKYQSQSEVIILIL